jgi:hypothetical protein
VRGNEIVGTARGPGGESKATLTLQGAVRTGSWADMADGCGQYYGK